MTSNPVRWFEIYVQEMVRAQKFYESVLQLKLDKLGAPEAASGPAHGGSSGPEMMGFPMAADGPGAGGALVKMTGVASGGNSVLIYFGCTDCAIEAGRVVAAGGRVQRDKMSIGPYGFIALAIDTEGNMFGLHSMQ